MAGVKEWQKPLIYEPWTELINVQQRHPQDLTSLQSLHKTAVFLCKYAEVKQSPCASAEGDAPAKHRAVSGAVAVTSP